jgi:hypothetical protein
MSPPREDGRKRGEYTTEIKMVYASPTMHERRFRSKKTLQWTMALALVCVG